MLLAQKDDAKQLPAIYRLGKFTADDQEAAESDRLLYVAATRAREKLILSGCITVKSDGTPGRLGGWLGRLSGEDVLGLAGVQVAVAETDPEPRRLDLAVGGTPVACAIYGVGWAWAARRSPAPAQPETTVPLPPPLLAPVAAEPVATDGRAAEQERDPGQRVWRVVPAAVRPRAPAWVVGKLVHEALAAWRFPDADGFFERWAEAHARSYGLTDARQLADAVRESAKLLLRFEEHPLHAEMAGAERRLHEVPYSLVAADGRVESGIIDALYLRDGGSTNGAGRSWSSRRITCATPRRWSGCWRKRTTWPRRNATRRLSSGCWGADRKWPCACSTMPEAFMSIDEDIRDRLRGVAVGAAIGDALGMPLEFGPAIPPDRLVRTMQAGRLPAGTFTDDTEMALALADSLLEHSPLDADSLARHFVAWYRAGPSDVGLQTRNVLGRIARGTPGRQPSTPSSEPTPIRRATAR